MNTQFQRFVATLLLLSMALQSCSSNLKLDSAPQTKDKQPKTTKKPMPQAPLKGGGQQQSRQHTHFRLSASEQPSTSATTPLDLSTPQSSPNPPYPNSTWYAQPKHTQTDALTAQAFTTLEGQKVQFIQTKQGWKALVTGLNQTTYLCPVVCQGDYTPESLALHKEAWQRRHIHCYTSKQGKKVVYIGVQGLPGGGGGCSRCRDSKEVHNPAAPSELEINKKKVSEEKEGDDFDDIQEAIGEGEEKHEKEAEPEVPQVAPLDHLLPRPPAANLPQEAESKSEGPLGVEEKKGELNQGKEISYYADLENTQSYLKQQGIPSLKTLVTHLNDVQDPGQQGILLNFIQNFIIEHFNKQSPLSLNSVDIQEYQKLAHIKPITNRHREVLKVYLLSLVSKIQPGQDNRSPASALGYSLRVIMASSFEMDQSDVFEGDPSLLTSLAVGLLKKLDPQENNFSASTYSTHRPIFEALYQTLTFIQLIAPNQWSRTLKDGLYSQFKQKLETIAASAARTNHLPTLYHTCLLQQSLAPLEKTGEILQECRERLGDGLMGVLYASVVVFPLIGAFFVPPTIITLPVISAAATERMVNRFEAAFTSMHTKQARWSQELQKINADIAQGLMDANSDVLQRLGNLQNDGPEGYIGHIKDFFFKTIDFVIGTDLASQQAHKALHYLIIGQLQDLALHAPSHEVRESSIDRLIDLSRTAAWSDEKEVMKEILESLALVATQRRALEDREREMEAQEAETHLRGLVKSLPTEIKEWLGEEKVNQLGATGALLEKKRFESRPAPERIFAKARQGLNGELESERKILLKEPINAQAAKEQLQNFYKENFGELPQLFKGSFEEETSQSIETAQALLRFSKKERIKGRLQEIRPEEISLENLFQTRRLIEGEPEKEIYKVLLVGDPGTGKTTLSRKLAHKWATGGLREGEFEAIYVLPVRELQKERYGDAKVGKEERLAKAIAELCFPEFENEEAYERTQLRIRASLADPRTLVVLDGLDERSSASEALINQALKGKHKLLVLSRSYGIEALREVMVRDLELGKGFLEVKHEGFSDTQMKEYVRSYFPEQLKEEAQALLSFIEGFPALQTTAHVPVNLAILCALWSDDSDAMRRASQRGSLPELYQQLMQSIWRRYTQKYPEKNLQGAHQEAIFSILGQIALKGLEEGKQLINNKVVRNVLRSFELGGLFNGQEIEKMLEGSGLLLLQKVGKEHQFPHLTFQEYFAGRVLARQFLSSTRGEQTKAERFLQEHKYQSQHQVALTFMAGEVSKEAGIDGIEGLLRTFDEEPQEVVGLQHLLLQLRCINEWLCLQAGEQTYPETITRLISSLCRWFEHGLERARKDKDHDDRLIKLLVATLRPLSGVLTVSLESEILPLLKKAIVDKDENVRIAAIDALGEFTKTENQFNIVFPLLQNAISDHDWRVRAAVARALGTLARVNAVFPDLIWEFLQRTMINPVPGSRNRFFLSNDTVLIGAIWALARLVEASPSFASQALSLLERDINHSNKWVRGAVCNALRSSGFTLSAILPLITNKVKSDISPDVRQPAIWALDEHVKALSEPNLEIFFLLQDALEDVSGHVRYAAIDLLNIYLRALPNSADRIIPLLQRASKEDSDPNVRRAAIYALSTQAKERPEFKNQILPTLREALRDPEPYVHLAAAGVLTTLGEDLTREELQNSNIDYAAIHPLSEYNMSSVSETRIPQVLREAMGHENVDTRCDAIRELAELMKSNSNYTSEVLPLLLEKATRDENEKVRRTAFTTLKDIPIEQLIENYWNTQNELLIRFITPQLFHVPLVIYPSQQQITLYHTTGQGTTWKKSQEACDLFRNRINKFMREMT